MEQERQAYTRSGVDDVGNKSSSSRSLRHLIYGGGEPSGYITSLEGGGGGRVQSSLDSVPRTAIVTAREDTDFETAREEVPAFPQWTDFSHLDSAIDNELFKAYSKGPDAQLCALQDCFQSVLSGVCFQWADIFKEPLASKLFDVPHFPATFGQSLSSIAFSDGFVDGFVLRSYTYIVDSAFNRPTERPDIAYHKSQVSTFFALATILRYSPQAFVGHLSSLRELQLWYKKQGVQTLPLTVWMIAQASRRGSEIGLLSWTRNLLPLLGDCDSQSTELILRLVENILDDPMFDLMPLMPLTPLRPLRPRVYIRPWHLKPLIPADSMEMLLRLRFPASQEATTRVASIYTKLKDVALGFECKQQREEAIQEMFAVCLRLSGEEGNPDLAKEARSIAIWCLKRKPIFRWDGKQKRPVEKSVCWEHWCDICDENVQASVALLKTLKEEWKDDEIRPFIGRMFTLSLRIAGQKDGPVLLSKEATEVAIWSLYKFSSVCWKLWDRLCEEDLEGSVGLLKLIVEIWKDNYLRLSLVGNKADKQFIQQMFTFSLRLAGKGDPDVVAINIWSLTENVDVCWNHWDNIYYENIEASAALLKTLVEKWKDHSVKLLSSPSDTLTLSSTIKSFRLKNEQATYALFHRASDDGYFHKVADKSCKVILGRLSRGSSGLKGTRIIALPLLLLACIIIAAGTVLSVWLL